jgi:hypothetical protein
MALALRYHHLGIPTTEEFAGSLYLAPLKMTVSDHMATPYGIQWMRFDDDCTFPDLVKRLPHVAFEVDDLRDAIRGKKVIIEPNEPAPGVLVAFIEEAGAPVEFLQFGRKGAPNLPPLQTLASIAPAAGTSVAPPPGGADR